MTHKMCRYKFAINSRESVNSKEPPKIIPQKHILGARVIGRDEIALFHFAVDDFEKRNDATVLVKPRVKEQHFGRFGLQCVCAVIGCARWVGWERDMKSTLSGKW